MCTEALGRAVDGELSADGRLRCGDRSWVVAAAPSDRQARIELVWVLLAESRRPSAPSLVLPAPPPPPRVRQAPPVAAAPVVVPAVAPPPEVALPVVPPPGPSPEAAPPEVPLAVVPPEGVPVEVPVEVAPAEVAPREVAPREVAPREVHPWLAVGVFDAVAPDAGARSAVWAELRGRGWGVRAAAGRSGTLVEGRDGTWSSGDVAAGPAVERGFLRTSATLGLSTRVVTGWDQAPVGLLPVAGAQAALTVPIHPAVRPTLGAWAEWDLRGTVVTGRGPDVALPRGAIGATLGLAFAVSP